MRKFLPLLALLLCSGPAWAQGIGPSTPITCNKIASATIASATTTSLVAGIAGQNIHLCGWHTTSNQTASTTFQFEYGTQGGPCTSPTTFSPAFSVTSNAPSSDHNNQAFFSMPTAAQFCVVTTGATVGTAIMVFFAQY